MNDGRIFKRYHTSRLTGLGPGARGNSSGHACTRSAPCGNHYKKVTFTKMIRGFQSSIEKFWEIFQ